MIHLSPYRGADGERSLDASGEIATVMPWELLQLERLGQFVGIYEL